MLGWEDQCRGVGTEDTSKAMKLKITSGFQSQSEREKARLIAGGWEMGESLRPSGHRRVR